MSRYLSILLASAILTACQSTPTGNVVVGHSYPAGNCEEVGQVIGNAATRENAHAQALEDLRYNAAQVEANYVRLVAEAAYGTVFLQPQY